MTLPSSGPISLNDIAAEFGLPGNAVFPTAFYGKGGAPASGPLSLADFYGRTNFAADYNVGNVYKTGSGTITASRDLAAAPLGGSGSFTYSWALSNQSGDATMTISSAVSANVTVRAVWSSTEPAQARADVTLTVTDTVSGQIRTITKNIGIS